MSTRAQRRRNDPVVWGDPEFATYAMCVVVKVLDSGLIPAGPLFDEIKALAVELTVASTEGMVEGIK
jgi:hypothetical protein